METQVNNTSKRPIMQGVAIYRGRGEVRRFNVCADCIQVNTHNLIKIRRVNGDIYLCHTHAALRGIG